MKILEITLKTENTYMNVVMVSEYLHVTKSTIYKWVESGYIPHKKLGKKVLFVKNQIDEWVLNNGETVNDLPKAPIYGISIDKHIPEVTKEDLSINKQLPIYHNQNVRYREAG